MSNRTPPPLEPITCPVPHPNLNVLLHRCGVNECNLLSDWCDSVLGRDYFFKRRHLLSILERQSNDVWAVTVDGHFAGLAIVYRSCVLDNLYIAPEYRETGVGSAVLAVIRPQRIRSKTNMLAGDPTSFYERNGYVRDQPDPERPHIIDMVRTDGAPDTTQAQGSFAPFTDQAAESTNYPGGASPSGENHATSRPACLTSPPAVERAGDGPGRSKSATGASHGIVPSPPLSLPAEPAAGAAILPSGHVMLTVEAYNELEKLRRNRERVQNYRQKRRAEMKTVNAPANGVAH